MIPSRPMFLLALVLFSLGCENSRNRPSLTAAEPPLEKIEGHGALRFPEESLSDWVSYADQVSVVKVVRETQEARPEVLTRGEGYVARKLLLSIEENLWSAPGKTPETGLVEMYAIGWILHDHKLALAFHDGAPRVVVGGEYVVPLVRLEMGWSPLTPMAFAPSYGNPQAEADAMENRQRGPATGISNLTHGEIRRLLAEVKVDPAVAPHMHLPPEARVRVAHQVPDAQRRPRPQQTWRPEGLDL